MSRSPNLKRLRKLIKLYSVHLVAICEPKMALCGFDLIRLKFGMDCCLANQWGTVWIFYQSPFRCQSVGESDQHLTHYIYTLNSFLHQFVFPLFMQNAQLRSERAYGLNYY